MAQFSAQTASVSSWDHHSSVNLRQMDFSLHASNFYEDEHMDRTKQTCCANCRQAATGHLKRFIFAN